MPIVLVACDLKQPGRDYGLFHEYLKQFQGCRGLGCGWLLDTRMPAEALRDSLRTLVGADDVVMVTTVSREWAAHNFGCAEWLNDPSRNW